MLGHAPTGPSHWWLQANDVEARNWADDHPREVSSGCITQPASQLDLVNVKRL